MIKSLKANFRQFKLKANFSSEGSFPKSYGAKKETEK